VAQVSVPAKAGPILALIFDQTVRSNASVHIQAQTMNFRPLQNHFAALVLLLLFSAQAMAATVQVTVNDRPITDVQISERSQLLRIEGRGASNSERRRMAEEELINEALKLSEADRLGITVTEADVDRAYENVARNANLTSTRLTQLLQEAGVNVGTLRERLRAGAAWSMVTQTAITPRVQISDLDVTQRAEQQVEESLSYDYLLQEIIFIVPQGSNSSISRRRAEAEQYRRSFQGCDSAVELSLSYTDAAVVDIGRRHATQLPEALANELAGLNEGSISSPRVIDNGVSMLAICSKVAARDLTFIKDEIRTEVGTEILQGEVDTYLQELREAAIIIRR
jgi:peptidyl-prolyl cis-trans isomerase SurA